MTFAFRVNGIPKAQPRVKACRRGSFAGVYDPGTADDWKTCVMAEAVKHRPESPIETPASLDVCFYMPRPKGHYGRKGLKPSAPSQHISKPDLDNCLKAVMDALNGLGFWRDDSQVCAVTARKVYQEQPGASIKLDFMPAISPPSPQS